MKKLNLLSRAEMKNVMGGNVVEGGLFCKTGACSHTIQGDNGATVTRTGSCATDPNLGFACYCDTGMGTVFPTSNGGHSRCEN